MSGRGIKERKPTGIRVGRTIYGEGRMQEQEGEAKGSIEGKTLGGIREKKDNTKVKRNPWTVRGEVVAEGIRRINKGRIEEKDNM